MFDTMDVTGLVVGATVVVALVLLSRAEAECERLIGAVRGLMCETLAPVRAALASLKGGERRVLRRVHLALVCRAGGPMGALWLSVQAAMLGGGVAILVLADVSILRGRVADLLGQVDTSLSGDQVSLFSGAVLTVSAIVNAEVAAEAAGFWPRSLLFAHARPSLRALVAIVAAAGVVGTIGCGVLLILDSTTNAGNGLNPLLDRYFWEAYTIVSLSAVACGSLAVNAGAMVAMVVVLELAYGLTVAFDVALQMIETATRWALEIVVAVVAVVGRLVGLVERVLERRRAAAAVAAATALTTVAVPALAPGPAAEGGGGDGQVGLVGPHGAGANGVSVEGRTSSARPPATSPAARPPATSPAAEHLAWEAPGGRTAALGPLVTVPAGDALARNGHGGPSAGR